MLQDFFSLSLKNKEQLYLKANKNAHFQYILLEVIVYMEVVMMKLYDLFRSARGLIKIQTSYIVEREAQIFFLIFRFWLGIFFLCRPRQFQMIVPSHMQGILLMTIEALLLMIQLAHACGFTLGKNCYIHIRFIVFDRCMNNNMVEPFLLKITAGMPIL